MDIKSFKPPVNPSLVSFPTPPSTEAGYLLNSTTGYLLNATTGYLLS